jgi:hypothetical protein
MEGDMEILNVFRYFATVVLDGDANNIWLFVLPDSLIDAAYQIGAYMAGLLFP